MQQSGNLLPTGPRPLLRASRGRPAAARSHDGLPAVLARTDAFELRLARTAHEVRRIQRLRYDVFFTERGAPTDRAAAALQRDQCPFDHDCDHLYVATVGDATPGRVVGTYRLLRDEVARTANGFYSETEFQLAPLLDRHRHARFLELGRSCVDPAFRSRRVIDLLWLGVGRYAAHHGSDVMIGCSSLPGTDTGPLAGALSFAIHHAAADAAWQVEPQPGRAARMHGLTPERADPVRALAALPPLMKAYVRAGATFASQAAVDHAFNTIDLFTVLPLTAAAPRYVARFGAGQAAVAA